MDLVHIQTSKKTTSIKINCNNFPKLIFSNVFDLLKHCDVLSRQFAVFSVISDTQEALFPTHKAFNKELS